MSSANGDSANDATTFDLEALEEPITRILSAPGVDLDTITANRVRQQLLQDASLGLTPEALKARKREVSRFIAQIYEAVSRSAANGEGSKRKREDDASEDGPDDQAEASDGGGVVEESRPSPKKKTKKTVEQSDAELARKLSSEINGRSRRAAASPKKTKRRVMKSSETVDSEDDGDGEGKKKKRGGGAKGGFAKEYTLSQPLATLVGAEKLSRPQVVKKLWEHIHAHKLQNPSCKKEILCDDGLRAVFGVDKIDMFRMNKVLGQHLHEE